MLRTAASCPSGEGFKTASHRGQVSWRGCVLCRFFRGGFLGFGCAFARNDKAGYLFARGGSGARGTPPYRNRIHIPTKYLTAESLCTGDFFATFFSSRKKCGADSVQVSIRGNRVRLFSFLPRGISQLRITHRPNNTVYAVKKADTGIADLPAAARRFCLIFKRKP